MSEAPRSPGSDESMLSDDAAAVLGKGPRKGPKDIPYPWSGPRVAGEPFPLASSDGLAPQAQALIEEMLTDHHSNPQPLTDSGLHNLARPKVEGPYTVRTPEVRTPRTVKVPESTPAITGIRGLIDMWNPERTKVKQRFYAGVANAAFKKAGVELPEYAALVRNDVVMHAAADERPLMPPKTRKQRRIQREVAGIIDQRDLIENPRTRRQKRKHKKQQDAVSLADELVKVREDLDQVEWAAKQLDKQRKINPHIHEGHVLDHSHVSSDHLIDRYHKTKHHKHLEWKEADITKKILRKTKPGWFNPRPNGVGVKTNRSHS